VPGEESVRFEAKFDIDRLIPFGVVVIAIWITLTAFRFLSPGPHPAPVWIFFAGWAILLAILANLWPAYCEIREAGLFLRRGWWHTLVSYDSVVELRPEILVDGRRFETRAERRLRLDAGVRVGMSERGIRIVRADGKHFWIAAAAEASLLVESLARCPQLNPATGTVLIHSNAVRQASP
jgi:hypothetical protein